MEEEKWNQKWWLWLSRVVVYMESESIYMECIYMYNINETNIICILSRSNIWRIDEWKIDERFGYKLPMPSNPKYWNHVEYIMRLGHK